jgi:putative heme-binding domain-containing protein
MVGAPLKSVNKAWFIGTVGDVKVEMDASLERGPVDLTAKFKTTDGERTWFTREDKDGSFNRVDSVGITCYVYFRLQSGVRQPAMLYVDDVWQSKVWLNGRPVGEGEEEFSLNKKVSLDIQPGSNDVLIRLRALQSPTSLRMQFRSKERLDAVLPEKTQPLKIARGKEEIGKEFLDIDWTKEARKGNAAEGRRLFGALNCAKCHAISPDQNIAGAPSLTDARKRFTIAHLVESILLPSRQVAEQFRATLITLANGQMMSGLVVNETEDTLELLLPDASRRTLRKKDIEERKVTDSSPMPSGLVKKPEELLDLLAYLLSDNPLPP